MCFKELPQDYTVFDKIDLQNNKRHFWTVQGLSLGITVVMIVGGWFIDRLTLSRSAEDFIALGVLVLAYVAYVILHEATHALVMRLSVKAKLNFGFKGWAAYAGSAGYFDKKHYIIIALAPLVLWGTVFAVLTAFFHSGIWFWVIWFLQIGNVGGAAGDIFCTYKMTTYPKDILVHDTGLNMTVYRKMTREETEKSAAEETVENDNGDKAVD